MPVILISIVCVFFGLMTLCFFSFLCLCCRYKSCHHPEFTPNSRSTANSESNMPDLVFTSTNSAHSSEINMELQTLPSYSSFPDSREQPMRRYQADAFNATQQENLTVFFVCAHCGFLPPPYENRYPDLVRNSTVANMFEAPNLNNGMV